MKKILSFGMVVFILSTFALKAQDVNQEHNTWNVKYCESPMEVSTFLSTLNVNQAVEAKVVAVSVKKVVFWVYYRS